MGMKVADMTEQQHDARFVRAFLFMAAFIISVCGMGLVRSLPAAAHVTTACDYAQASWTDGTNTVISHSNGPYPHDEATADSCHSSHEIYDLNGNPSIYGYGWQCQEFATRVYNIEGWHSGTFGVGYAALLWGMGTSDTTDYTTMAQGSITLTNVEPGDMLVTNEAYYGHVFIVQSVDSDHNIINAVDQNGDDGGTATISYNSTTKNISDGSYFVFEGVVHSKNDHLSTTPPANPTPSYQTSSNSGAVVTESAAPTVGFTQVFTEGANNTLTTRWEVPGSTSWSTGTVGASSGTTYSAPSVAVSQSAQTFGSSTTQAGFTQVFVQGPNNSLVTYWEVPGVSSWSAPLTIAGNGTTYSAPAAVVNQVTGLVQVFAEGPSNSLDTYWANVGQSWSSGVLAGSGTTYSTPTATVTDYATAAPAGFTQVFAEGPSNSLDTYWATPGSTSWSSGTIAGSGTTYSAPAAVVTQKATSYTSAGFTQVFAQGPSNGLKNYWATPGTTSFSAGTLASSGTTYSDPTATVTEPTGPTPAGFTQVFTQGPSNGLSTYWATPGYTSWSAGSIAGSGTTYSAPAGIVTQTTGATSAGFTHIFAQGSSNSLADYWAVPGSTSWSSGVPGGANTTYSAP
jgi:hypothetical protein